MLLLYTSDHNYELYLSCNCHLFRHSDCVVKGMGVWQGLANGHGFPKVSLKPVMPYPTLLHPECGPPTGRAGCARIQPLWTPYPRRMPMEYHRFRFCASLPPPNGVHHFGRGFEQDFQGIPVHKDTYFVFGRGFEQGFQGLAIHRGSYFGRGFEQGFQGVAVHRRSCC
jgi:hypothetical protein